MPFKKGQPRPAGAGRKAGHSVRDSALEIMERMNCNPIEGMAMIALDPKTKTDLRARMYAELARYGWPQLRAVELTGKDGGSISVDVNASEVLAGRIASLAARVGEAGSAAGTKPEPS